MSALIWLIGFALGATPLASPNPYSPIHQDAIGPSPEPVPQTFVYKTIAGVPLKLDLYFPRSEGPHPCAMFIHGGGWRAGTRTNPHPSANFAELLRAGVAVASVDYRLTSQPDLFAPESVLWPAQFQDVSAAAQWLDVHAKSLGLKPGELIAWGTSAGGHLSAMLALVDTGTGSKDVSGAVNLFGSVDYRRWRDVIALTPDVPGLEFIDALGPDGAVAGLLGWTGPGQGVLDVLSNFDNPNAPYPALANALISIEPSTHVDASDAPLLIVHGTADDAIPYGGSVLLNNDLLASAVESELLSVPGGDHGENFPDDVWIQVRQWIIFSLDPRLAADTNRDGSVDEADITAIEARQGELGGFEDVNGDGIVNGVDLDIATKLAE